MSVDSGDVAIILAMVTFVAFLWQVVRERHLPHVDMSEAAQNLIGPYRDEVMGLRAEVSDLRASNEAMLQRMNYLEEVLRDRELGIGLLMAQMDRHGMQPEWRPRNFGTGPLLGEAR